MQTRNHLAVILTVSIVSACGSDNKDKRGDGDRVKQPGDAEIALGETCTLGGGCEFGQCASYPIKIGLLLPQLQAREVPLPAMSAIDVDDNRVVTASHYDGLIPGGAVRLRTLVSSLTMFIHVNGYDDEFSVRQKGWQVCPPMYTWPWPGCSFIEGETLDFSSETVAPYLIYSAVFCPTNIGTSGGVQAVISNSGARWINVIIPQECTGGGATGTEIPTGGPGSSCPACLADGAYDNGVAVTSGQTTNVSGTGATGSATTSITGVSIPSAGVNGASTVDGLVTPIGTLSFGANGTLTVVGGTNHSGSDKTLQVTLTLVDSATGVTTTKTITLVLPSTENALPYFSAAPYDQIMESGATKTFEIRTTDNDKEPVDVDMIVQPPGAATATLGAFTPLNAWTKKATLTLTASPEFRTGTVTVTMVARDGQSSQVSPASIHTFRITVKPAPMIMDDGDAGFSSSWTSGPSDAFFRGDVAYAHSDGVPTYAVYRFTDLVPGRYRVAATWFPNETYAAAKAGYLVMDGDWVRGATTVNQRQAPFGYEHEGRRWRDLGSTYDVLGTTLTVKVTNAGAEGHVFADGIRIERVGDAAARPRGWKIVDDADTTAFTPVGPTIAGTQGLTFGHDGGYHYAYGGLATEGRFSVDGLAPGQYRISATWVNNPYFASNAMVVVRDGTTIVGTALLNQKLAPGLGREAGTAWQNLPGTYTTLGSSLTVSFTNVGANGFVIADAIRIERVGEPLTNLRIVDDGHASFSASPAQWGVYSGGVVGHEGTFHYASSYLDTEATYTVVDLTPGRYRLALSWASNPLAWSSKTSYKVWSAVGQALLAFGEVDQKVEPDDFSQAGSAWEYLPGAVNVWGGRFVLVVSSKDAEGIVVADGLRIEKVADDWLPPPPVEEYVNGVTCLIGHQQTASGPVPIYGTCGAATPVTDPAATGDDSGDSDSGDSDSGDSDSGDSDSSDSDSGDSDSGDSDAGDSDAGDDGEGEDDGGPTNEPPTPPEGCQTTVVETMDGPVYETTCPTLEPMPTQDGCQTTTYETPDGLVTETTCPSPDAEPTPEINPVIQ